MWREEVGQSLGTLGVRTSSWQADDYKDPVGIQNNLFISKSNGFPDIVQILVRKESIRRPIAVV